MSKQSFSRILSLLLLGATLFAVCAAAQDTTCACPNPSVPSAPIKIDANSQPTSEPDELESYLASQWTTASGAETNIEVLKLYTSGDAKNALDTLKSTLSQSDPDQRLSVILDTVPKDQTFWENVATAGAKKLPVGVITNDADLFKRVEQAIAYRYTKAEPTQLAALGKANSAAQDEKDYLKALYFLLSALPEPKSSASKTITAAERDDTCASTCRLNEIQLYRTCFYKNRGKLFSFLKEHFTATKTAGASQ